jgi:LysM repeat protein
MGQMAQRTEIIQNAWSPLLDSRIVEANPEQTDITEDTLKKFENMGLPETEVKTIFGDNAKHAELAEAVSKHLPDSPPNTDTRQAAQGSLLAYYTRQQAEVSLSPDMRFVNTLPHDSLLNIKFDQKGLVIEIAGKNRSTIYRLEQSNDQWNVFRLNAGSEPEALKEMPESLSRALEHLNADSVLWKYAMPENLAYQRERIIFSPEKATPEEIRLNLEYLSQDYQRFIHEHSPALESNRRVAFLEKELTDLNNGKFSQHLKETLEAFTKNPNDISARENAVAAMREALWRTEVCENREMPHQWHEAGQEQNKIPLDWRINVSPGELENLSKLDFEKMSLDDWIMEKAGSDDPKFILNGRRLNNVQTMALLFMQDNRIVDVPCGGGKTLLVIMDALLRMQAGEKVIIETSTVDLAGEMFKAFEKLEKLGFLKLFGIENFSRDIVRFARPSTGALPELDKIKAREAGIVIGDRASIYFTMLSDTVAAQRGASANNVFIRYDIENSRLITRINGDEIDLDRQNFSPYVESAVAGKHSFLQAEFCIKVDELAEKIKGDPDAYGRTFVDGVRVELTNSVKWLEFIQGNTLDDFVRANSQTLIDYNNRHAQDGLKLNELQLRMLVLEQLEYSLKHYNNEVSVTRTLALDAKLIAEKSNVPVDLPTDMPSPSSRYMSPYALIELFGATQGAADAYAVRHNNFNRGNGFKYAPPKINDIVHSMTAGAREQIFAILGWTHLGESGTASLQAGTGIAGKIGAATAETGSIAPNRRLLEWEFFLQSATRQDRFIEVYRENTGLNTGLKQTNPLHVCVPESDHVPEVLTLLCRAHGLTKVAGRDIEAIKDIDPASKEYKTMIKELAENKIYVLDRNTDNSEVPAILVMAMREDATVVYTPRGGQGIDWGSVYNEVLNDVKSTALANISSKQNSLKTVLDEVKKAYADKLKDIKQSNSSAADAAAETIRYEAYQQMLTYFEDSKFKTYIENGTWQKTWTTDELQRFVQDETIFNARSPNQILYVPSRSILEHIQQISRIARAGNEGRVVALSWLGDRLYTQAGIDQGVWEKIASDGVFLNTAAVQAKDLREQLPKLFDSVLAQEVRDSNWVQIRELFEDVGEKFPSDETKLVFKKGFEDRLEQLTTRLLSGQAGDAYQSTQADMHSLHSLWARTPYGEMCTLTAWLQKNNVQDMTDRLLTNKPEVDRISRIIGEIQNGLNDPTKVEITMQLIRTETAKYVYAGVFSQSGALDADKFSDADANFARDVLKLGILENLGIKLNMDKLPDTADDFAKIVNEAYFAKNGYMVMPKNYSPNFLDETGIDFLRYVQDWTHAKNILEKNTRDIRNWQDVDDLKKFLALDEAQTGWRNTVFDNIARLYIALDDPVHSGVRRTAVYTPYKFENIVCYEPVFIKGKRLFGEQIFTGQYRWMLYDRQTRQMVGVYNTDKEALAADRFYSQPDADRLQIPELGDNWIDRSAGLPQTAIDLEDSAVRAETGSKASYWIKPGSRLESKVNKLAADNSYRGEIVFALIIDVDTGKAKRVIPPDFKSTINLNDFALTQPDVEKIHDLLMAARVLSLSAAPDGGDVAKWLDQQKTLLAENIQNYLLGRGFAPEQVNIIKAQFADFYGSVDKIQQVTFAENAIVTPAFNEYADRHLRHSNEVPRNAHLHINGSGPSPQDISSGAADVLVRQPNGRLEIIEIPSNPDPKSRAIVARMSTTAAEPLVEHVVQEIVNAAKSSQTEQVETDSRTAAAPSSRNIPEVRIESETTRLDQIIDSNPQIIKPVTEAAQLMMQDPEILLRTERIADLEAKQKLGIASAAEIADIARLKQEFDVKLDEVFMRHYRAVVKNDAIGNMNSFRNLFKDTALALPETIRDSSTGGVLMGIVISLFQTYPRLVEDKQDFWQGTLAWLDLLNRGELTGSAVWFSMRDNFATKVVLNVANHQFQLLEVMEPAAAGKINFSALKANGKIGYTASVKGLQNQTIANLKYSLVAMPVLAALGWFEGKYDAQNDPDIWEKMLNPDYFAQLEAKDAEEIYAKYNMYANMAYEIPSMILSYTPIGHVPFSGALKSALGVGAVMLLGKVFKEHFIPGELKTLSENIEKLREAYEEMGIEPVGLDAAEWLENNQQQILSRHNTKDGFLTVGRAGLHFATAKGISFLAVKTATRFLQAASAAKTIATASNVVGWASFALEMGGYGLRLAARSKKYPYDELGMVDFANTYTALPLTEFGNISPQKGAQELHFEHIATLSELGFLPVQQIMMNNPELMRYVVRLNEAVREKNPNKLQEMYNWWPVTGDVLKTVDAVRVLSNTQDAKLARDTADAAQDIHSFVEYMLWQGMYNYDLQEVWYADSDLQLRYAVDPGEGKEFTSWFLENRMLQLGLQQGKSAVRGLFGKALTDIRNIYTNQRIQYHSPSQSSRGDQWYSAAPEERENLENQDMQSYLQRWGITVDFSKLPENSREFENMVVVDFAKLIPHGVMGNYRVNDMFNAGGFFAENKEFFVRFMIWLTMLADDRDGVKDRKLYRNDSLFNSWTRKQVEEKITTTIAGYNKGTFSLDYAYDFFVKIFKEDMNNYVNYFDVNNCTDLPTLVDAFLTRQIRDQHAGVVKSDLAGINSADWSYGRLSSVTARVIDADTTMALALLYQENNTQVVERVNVWLESDDPAQYQAAVQIIKWDSRTVEITNDDEPKKTASEQLAIWKRSSSAANRQHAQWIDILKNPPEREAGGIAALLDTYADLNGLSDFAIGLRAKTLSAAEYRERAVINNSSVQAMQNRLSMQQHSKPFSVSERYNDMSAVEFIERCILSATGRPIPKEEQDGYIYQFLYINKLQQDSILKAGQKVYLPSGVHQYIFLQPSVQAVQTHQGLDRSGQRQSVQSYPGQPPSVDTLLLINDRAYTARQTQLMLNNLAQNENYAVFKDAFLFYAGHKGLTPVYADNNQQVLAETFYQQIVDCLEKDGLINNDNPGQILNELCHYADFSIFYSESYPALVPARLIEEYKKYRELATQINAAYGLLEDSEYIFNAIKVHQLFAQAREIKQMYPADTAQQKIALTMLILNSGLSFASKETEIMFLFLSGARPAQANVCAARFAGSPAEKELAGFLLAAGLIDRAYVQSQRGGEATVTPAKLAARVKTLSPGDLESLADYFLLLQDKEPQPAYLAPLQETVLRSPEFLLALLDYAYTKSTEYYLLLEQSINAALERSNSNQTLLRQSVNNLEHSADSHNQDAAYFINKILNERAAGRRHAVRANIKPLPADARLVYVSTESAILDEYGQDTGLKFPANTPLQLLDTRAYNFGDQTKIYYTVVYQVNGTERLCYIGDQRLQQTVALADWDKAAGTSFYNVLNGVNQECRLINAKAWYKDGEIFKLTETQMEYTVRSGDTLSEIARRHGISLQELYRLNPVVDPANGFDAKNLQSGTKINVPVKSNAPVGTAIAAAPSSGQQPDVSQAATYTVASGDVLSIIGQKLGLRWQDIAQFNNISPPYTIHLGQVLKLPSRQD